MAMLRCPVQLFELSDQVQPIPLTARRAHTPNSHTSSIARTPRIARARHPCAKLLEGPLGPTGLGRALGHRPRDNGRTARDTPQGRLRPSLRGTLAPRSRNGLPVARDVRGHQLRATARAPRFMSQVRDDPEMQLLRGSPEL